MVKVVAAVFWDCWRASPNCFEGLSGPSSQHPSKTPVSQEGWWKAARLFQNSQRLGSKSPNPDSEAFQASVSIVTPYSQRKPFCLSKTSPTALAAFCQCWRPDGSAHLFFLPNHTTLPSRQPGPRASLLIPWRPSPTNDLPVATCFCRWRSTGFIIRPG